MLASPRWGEGSVRRSGAPDEAAAEGGGTPGLAECVESGSASGPLHRAGFACASCMDGKSMQASPSGGGEAAELPVATLTFT